MPTYGALKLRLQAAMQACSKQQWFVRTAKLAAPARSAISIIGTVASSPSPQTALRTLFHRFTSNPLGPSGWARWALCGTAVLAGAMASLVAVSAAAPLDPATGQLRTMDEWLTEVRQADLVGCAARLPTVGLAMPILEEAVFRGLLMSTLMMLWGSPWAANLVSALAFALYRDSVPGIPPNLAVGLVCGWSYMRSNSLLAPIAIHCTWNIFAAVVKHGWGNGH